MQFLLRCHREQRWHAELLTGILASTIANCAPTDRQQPFTPADFMPLQRARPQQATALTAEDRQRIAQKTGSFFDSLLKK